MTTIFDLTGKIALVTGASRGIGASIARLLAEQGAHVILSSRKAEGCEGVATEIRNAGGKAEVMPCHIGEMEQIEQIFSAIREKHGRLDILVNNAATNPHFGPIHETDLTAFQKTVDVNIRGYFFMCARAVKLMGEPGDPYPHEKPMNGVTIGTWEVSRALPDLYDCVAKLEWAYQNREKLRALGKNGRAAIMREYDWNGVVGPEWMRFLKQITEEGK